jgi:hypothetical protein
MTPNGINVLYIYALCRLTAMQSRILPAMQHASTACACMKQGSEAAFARNGRSGVLTDLLRAFFRPVIQRRRRFKAKSGCRCMPRAIPQRFTPMCVCIVYEGHPTSLHAWWLITLRELSHASTCTCIHCLYM